MVRTTAEEEDEQRLLDDVAEFGWHFIAIAEDEEGPGFVYTVGLFHTFGHPELIVFGLDSTQTMATVLSAVADLIRGGRTFADGSTSDDVLEGFACRFRSVPVEAYREYLGYARWYYEGNDFPVLQCLWPDRDGSFPDEPDYHETLRWRQPLLADLRVAPTETWAFDVPPEQTVFTTGDVLDRSEPVRFATHSREGHWTFISGVSRPGSQGRLVTLRTVLDVAPELVEIADLPCGWTAERTGAEAEWVRREEPPED